MGKTRSCGTAAITTSDAALKDHRTSSYAVNQIEGPDTRSQTPRLDPALHALPPDQPSDAVALHTYTLEEVASEKLRCVIQRLVCRDISDLHRLLVREGVDVEESWARFEEKARFKNLDPALFAERLNGREPSTSAGGS